MSPSVTPCMAGQVFNMADDIEPTEQPIKSATDLELERLSARLDALETENKELRSANQGLWAQLHPATDEPVEVQPVRTENIAYNVLADKLGIKEQ